MTVNAAAINRKMLAAGQKRHFSDSNIGNSLSVGGLGPPTLVRDPSVYDTVFIHQHEHAHHGHSHMHSHIHSKPDSISSVGECEGEWWRSDENSNVNWELKCQLQFFSFFSSPKWETNLRWYRDGNVFLKSKFWTYSAKSSFSVLIRYEINHALRFLGVS